MQLLVDLFGYLSIVLHGLTIVGQAVTLGSVLFLVFLARPHAWMMGDGGAVVIADTTRIARWAALGLVVGESIVIAMQTAVLTSTTGIGLADALGADFAIAGLAKIAATLALFGVLLLPAGRMSSVLLVVVGALELAAGTLTTHAVARLDDRPLLLAATALHQFGAAIWIGGIPAFIAALKRGTDQAAWRLVGERFSTMCQIGVVAILISASILATWYIGSVPAAYGTAYGVMAGAKAVMFAALLTHSHAIANIRDQLLIEITHTPLALAGVAAGWARWLELRLDDGPGKRVAGWVWPLCLVLVGLVLLDYREA